MIGKQQKLWRDMYVPFNKLEICTMGIKLKEKVQSILKLVGVTLNGFVKVYWGSYIANTNSKYLKYGEEEIFQMKMKNMTVHTLNVLWISWG